LADGHCFVCGIENPAGLHIHFEEVEGEAVAMFRCEERYAGWPGVQHGGITAALLDEAAGYIPQFRGLIAMTAKLDISFLEPIRVGEVVRVVGRLIHQNRRVMDVHAEIAGEDGTVRAHATAKMMVLTEQQRAKLKLDGVSGT
jgi:uncharacterized protein (TIGR00369 family)